MIGPRARRATATAARELRALGRDLARAAEGPSRAGTRAPRLRAAADPSLWALALLRAGTALRAATGSTLGTRLALRVVFHIDVWTDDVGGGLRLPHPFNIVVGDGASIGEDCTLMHGVTVQRGGPTVIGDGAVLGACATVLSGAVIGAGALIGCNSVVRGPVPAGTVAVGAPATVVRPVRAGEARARA